MASMKLVFEKGPRNGEIRTYNPRSKVRIGRIVRGNNLNIKDDAISSQHLTIQFDSGSGKWVITDLDSSNGTHLNSSKLKPFSPFPLSNADEIKIGDSTSIRVEIVGEICDPNKKPKVVTVDEECPEGGSVAVKKGVDSGVNLGIEDRNGRGRGRPKKESDGVILNVEEDAKPEEEQRMARRSTRNSKKATAEILCLEKVMHARRTRRRRSMKKASASHFEEDVPERVENDMIMGGGEVEKTGVEEIDEELDDTEVDKGEIKEHKFETLPDLEKITLGDFIDYLQVSSTKQLHDARDEVISDVRKTAERVCEYVVMVQQQNEKGKARTELHMS